MLLLIIFNSYICTMTTAVSDIEEIVKAVLFRNRELDERISVLETEKTQLEKEKVALEKENAALRKQLSSANLPVKDSRNSSIPPGKENIKSETIRRTRSLRTPTGCKPGGQSGHQGSTLLKRETADKIQTHAPDYCIQCGLSLSTIQGKEVEIRQSIDIPLPVCPIVTNHVCMEKKCSCGKCNRGTFPSHVKPGVSYGVNLHAVVAYLSTVQNIPFKRLTGTLKDLYGIRYRDKPGYHFQHP
jgi:transposase